MNTTASLRTSDLTVLKTGHLQRRQEERNIQTRELQAAVKHGTKSPQHSDRILHKHEGVNYVTDAMGRLGITSYRDRDSQW